MLGIHEVFGELHARAGFAKALSQRYTRTGRLLRDAVLMRLAEPGRSKLAHARQMEDHMGKHVPVDKFYRMMDALDDDRIAKLQELVARQCASLLDDEIGVLFADATTLHFEANQPDDLRRRGYSKDGKPHRLQLVLAVVMAAAGLPAVSGQHCRPSDAVAGAGGLPQKLASEPAAGRGRGRWHRQQVQPGGALGGRLRIHPGRETSQTAGSVA